VVSRFVFNGYYLLFCGYPSHAVATIEKRSGGSVSVLMWDIQSEDEQALDRVIYIRQSASLKAGGFETHYTVRVLGKETYIWLENGGKQWFMKTK
jgi:hypothetical protein